MGLLLLIVLAAPPPVSWTEVGVTAVLGVGAMSLEVVPGPENARWTSTNGVDEAGRDALRLEGGEEGARLGSDVGLVLAAAHPLAALFAGRSERPQRVVLAHAQVIFTTSLLTRISKLSTARARPWTRGGEAGRSPNVGFWSGHAALAFATVSSGCALQSRGQLYGEGATPWVCAGGYAVASSVAGLRVLGDEHYLSDVIVGALVGSAIGWALPLAHDWGRLEVSPGGGRLTIPF